MMFGNALRLSVLFAVVLFASTACSGSGQSASAPTAVEPPVDSAASSSDFAHGPFLFVTNDLGISIFPLSANGDVAPVKTIPNLNSPSPLRRTAICSRASKPPSASFA